MKSSTRTGAGISIVALGALVAMTPRFLFPVCEYHGIFMQLGNGKTAHMSCFYTARGSYILGAMIGLIGLTMIFARERETMRMLSVVLAGIAAAVVLLPWIYPVCANPDEPCNHGTKPLLIVLGIIAFITAAWLRMASRKTNAIYSSSKSDQSDVKKEQEAAVSGA